MGVCNIVAYDREMEQVRSRLAYDSVCCLFDDCEWFLDYLPGISCSYGGKERCMLHVRDCEEIAEICPHSKQDE
ncbi:MAG: hypothetical protein ACXV3U_03970 [Halobacteriota archaeon]